MAIARREFLKTASLAAGAAALPHLAAGDQGQRPAAVTISGTPYQHRPDRDYPIRAKRFSDVRLAQAIAGAKQDIEAVKGNY